MKKLTFAVMGMGNRGTAYAAKQLKYPEEMEITAMADTRRVRLDAANKYLHLPEDRLFDSAEALLEQPKLADIMVVATQDDGSYEGCDYSLDGATVTFENEDLVSIRSELCLSKGSPPGLFYIFLPHQRL